MERILFDETNWFDSASAEVVLDRSTDGEFAFRASTVLGRRTVVCKRLWRTRLGKYVVDDGQGNCWSVSESNAAQMAILYADKIPEALQGIVDSLEG